MITTIELTEQEIAKMTSTVAKAMGSKGGKATLAKHGVGHFKDIASKPRKRKKFDKNKK